MHGIGFAVLYWDSDKIHYGNKNEEQFCLSIKDEIAGRSLLSGGSLRFGEAYCSGEIEIEGNIQAYLRMRHINGAVRNNKSLLAKILKIITNNKNRKNRKENISYHYDLGNDFFKQFLDKETMTYSGAYFRNGKDDLVKAQIVKMDDICRRLNLSKGQTILDIGSGWGEFAVFAAKNYGVNVVGITLSENQFYYAQKRVEQENIDSSVKFVLNDFLNYDAHQIFDAVVSIECLEHIGKEKIPDFFLKISQLLKKTGRGLIQVSARLIAKPTDRWTTTHIFPGGYFPSIGEIVSGTTQANLAILDINNRREHYVTTLDHWLNNFATNRELVEDKFGSYFTRIWWLWLNGAKVSFDVGALQSFQISFLHP